MKRKNREVNIFSMSALDLFASAMGAFILIAVIALPYYLKTDKGLFKENAEVKKELARVDADRTALQKQNKALDQDNQKLKQWSDDLNKKNQQLQQQADSLSQEKQKLQQQAEALKKQIDNAVSFALLGIATKAQSFTIVIDMSGSMQEFTAVMEKTVGRILDPLKETNQVQIFGYNGEFGHTKWQMPYNTAGMTQSNKSQAMSFVRSLSAKFDGSTPTYDALREALKYDTEAIILLTDGAPDQKMHMILKNITAQNAGKKEIHTVGLGNVFKGNFSNKNDQTEMDFANFLQSLAKRNKGAFLSISN